MAPKPKPPITITDYKGAAARAGVATPASSTNPNDIWGLGNLYGQQVYNGEVSLPLQGRVAEANGLPPGGTSPSYSTTQDYMQHVVDLWAAQQHEQQQHPNQLTTFEQIQRQLWQAGFYGQTSIDSVHVGQWTSQTENALQSALGQYEEVRKQGLPFTFAEFLNQNAQSTAQGGKDSQKPSGSSTSTKAPFQASLTDPASIRAAAQSAAQQALGRNLNDGQLRAFVEQFQAAQTAAEQANYGGTGTVTAPDLSSDAMAFVQQQNPGDYAGNKRTQYLDALVNMMGGNRPSANEPVSPVG